MSINPNHPRYQRTLGKNGQFNIQRIGPQNQWDVYHYLLKLSWPKFFLISITVYLLINLVFASLYFYNNNSFTNASDSFADAFFFSVQTLSTIGYGRMAPVGLTANILVTIEVVVGMLTLAVITGLAFSRFSRPTALVLFSDVAVVTRFEGKPVLMFRMANQRSNEIVKASLTASLWRRELTPEGHKFAKLHDVKFERDTTPVFSLTWTAIHVIDEKSPLYGISPESGDRFEIIVILTGLDATFSQSIHARTSYTCDEIIWNARFTDVIFDLPDGRRAVDLTKFHQVEQEAA